MNITSGTLPSGTSWIGTPPACWSYYPAISGAGWRKILVIGAAGLIGKAIAQHLRDTGYQVFALDLKETPYPRGEESDPYYAVIDCARYDTMEDQLETLNHVVDGMKRNNCGGRLILFSSIYGHKAPDFEMYDGTEINETPLEYATLKGGVEQATRYLAQKLKPYQAQVNCIAPGGVQNGHSEDFMEKYWQSGWARMIQPKNLFPVIDALLHPDNAVNGEVITVDGGWCL